MPKILAFFPPERYDEKNGRGGKTMLRVPDYYKDFHCLAGSCPHSCCEAWEVVLDGDTAARYRCVPGALGEKLRAAMTEE